MSSVVISGDTSGAITLQAPSVAGNTTLNLPASSGTVLTQNSSAPANSFVVDASGNVGIGTASPSEKLEVIAGTAQTARMVVGGGDTAVIVINGDRDNSGDTGTEDCALVFNTDGTYSQSTNSGLGSNGFRIGALNNAAASQLTFTSINGGVDTERMRIDGSGNVLVGTTTAQSGTENTNAGASVYPAGAMVLSRATTTTNLYLTKVGAVGSGGFISFAYNGSAIGSITNTSTTVAYNTSSDYRLKENVAPMTGALETVAQLKPVTYNWKADGSEGQGFIAHELQEVVPDAVTGEKDAVDAEGNPVYQGVDTSFLVATLTKAIQELKAIVDEQAEKIKALEAK